MVQVGSGGTGETHIILAPFLARRCGFERWSRCLSPFFGGPTGAGVGPQDTLLLRVIEKFRLPMSKKTLALTTSVSSSVRYP